MNAIQAGAPPEPDPLSKAVLDERARCLRICRNLSRYYQERAAAAESPVLARNNVIRHELMESVVAALSNPERSE